MRKFIAAYRKRRIDADEIRRALVVDGQLKAQRERDEHQKKTNYEKIVVVLERIHNEQKAYSEQQKANDNRQEAPALARHSRYSRCGHRRVYSCRTTKCYAWSIG